MSLQTLQQQFFENITQAKSASYNIVKDEGSISRDERIQIYYDAYRFRLIDALSDSYPAVHTLLGDKEFEKICRQYIDAHPPTHFSIRYYGDKLGDFVKHNVLTPNPALIAEMARFEWALRHAFDAKDEQMLTLDSLQNSSIEHWSDVIFHTPQSLVCLDLYWNVPALWKVIEQGDDPIREDENPLAEHWIIWRPDLETYFRSVSEIEYKAFEMLIAKHTFGEMCDKIEKLDDNPAQLAANFLSGWINEGLIASIGDKNIT